MASVVWLSPLEAIQHVWLFLPPLSSWRLRPYRLHRHYGRWSHLAWQWSPTLTGLWWLSHQCTLWGLAACWFLGCEVWSLAPFCLLAIVDSAFPKFSGRSFSQRRRDQFGYLSHSLVCLSSVSWYTCSIKSSDPPKTCTVPVCIPLCFSRLRGVDCGYFRWNWSMLWLASFCVWFTLVLAWTSWSQRVCPWWFRHDRTGWLGVKRKEKRKKGYLPR